VTDTASVQVGADLAGAVALVRDHVVGPGPGPTGPEPWDADGLHDLLEGGAVVGVTAGQNEAEGAAPAVTGEVDLGAQSSTGSAEGVITRFVRIDRPFLPPAACW
jgi:hypothetical protein